VEPLIRLRALLQARGVLDEAREHAMKAQYAQEVEDSVKEYLGTPKQSTDAMFDFLFANPPRSIEAQKEIARRFAGTGRPSH
jgi:2-oxoisovalerate dehydrogenase E1 component alpha subunit